MKKRPNWVEYYLKMCELVATRSTCLRRAVGAVLVKNNKVLATGYNGAPSGMEHCEVVGCLRQKMKVKSGERHELCNGLHAEQNVLLQCAIHGVSSEGATLYSTTYPCSICAKMICNSGIKDVIVTSDYPDKMAKTILNKAGISVTIYGCTKKSNKKVR